MDNLIFILFVLLGATTAILVISLIFMIIRRALNLDRNNIDKRFDQVIVAATIVLIITVMIFVIII